MKNYPVHQSQPRRRILRKRGCQNFTNKPDQTMPKTKTLSLLTGLELFVKFYIQINRKKPYSVQIRHFK